MADIVNLNRVRKAKAKAERAVEAQNNRIVFGRNKAEKDTARKEAERAKRDLDGKSLDD